MSHAADFGITLTQHIHEKQSVHPEATGQLTALLTQIGVAGKLIAAQVRRAGLIELWGAAGHSNVQGERVQKLDDIANDTFIEVLRRSGAVAVMASEEEDEVIVVEEGLAGDYAVVFDPLDGSSNIDANVSIGTVFGIFRCDDGPRGPRDVLRPGREMVAAGYIIYGSSTALVYTTGDTVDYFTLDPGSGEYFLTREAVTIEETTSVLSLNECNAPYWEAWVQPYLDEVKSANDQEKRRVSARHIGSLVADAHRNLLYGGVYLYPVDKRTGRGKLRVLYECNPLAFIFEVAGGAASTGRGGVLDVVPTGLHDRTGFIIGSRSEVARAEAAVRTYSPD
jgi:fructose-1,6-bisphosphatase I